MAHVLKNGEIVASGIEVINSIYSSQFIVTVNPDMKNASVSVFVMVAQNDHRDMSSSPCNRLGMHDYQNFWTVINVGNKLQSFIYLLMVFEYQTLDHQSSSLFIGVHQVDVHWSSIMSLQQLTVEYALLKPLIHLWRVQI